MEVEIAADKTNISKSMAKFAQAYDQNTEPGTINHEKIQDGGEYLKYRYMDQGLDTVTTACGKLH